MIPQVYKNDQRNSDKFTEIRQTLSLRKIRFVEFELVAAPLSTREKTRCHKSAILKIYHEVLWIIFNSLFSPSGF